FNYLSTNPPAEGGKLPAAGLNPPPTARCGRAFVPAASGPWGCSHGRSDVMDQLDHARADLPTETIFLYRVADARATEAEGPSGSGVDKGQADGGNIRPPC